MLRKFGLGLLCIAASFSTSSYSMESHSLIQGTTFEVELPPNTAQLFVNYMFWTVETNCKIDTEDQSNNLYVEAMVKKGKVNDVPVSAGDKLTITVHQNDNLRISADSGAKVQITNLGEHKVKATCIA
ncbi:MAG: hypothetical protein ACRCXC_10805 [Legionella sp.]